MKKSEIKMLFVFWLGIFDLVGILYFDSVYNCQLFTNHLSISFYITNLMKYFTQPVYQWLPINCQYIITNHSIGNFLSIGSQHFTNHKFTNGTGKFTNSCQWFTIGSYWQWYTGVCLCVCLCVFVWDQIRVQQKIIDCSSPFSAGLLGGAFYQIFKKGEQDLNF